MTVRFELSYVDSETLKRIYRVYKIDGKDFPSCLALFKQQVGQPETSQLGEN